jgi:cytochrome b pre-mRNA-processing protein 3
LEAGAEDSMDGRFAVLATMVALADIRLGAGGIEAAALSPRLTEVFVDDMDAQLRQSGLGDPTVGKQVRAMVGMLALRIDRWRAAGDDRSARIAAARLSLYHDRAVDDGVGDKAVGFIDDFAARLANASDHDLREGVI